MRESLLYFRAYAEPTDDPCEALYEAVIDGVVVRASDPRLILLDAPAVPLDLWRDAA